MWFDVKAALAEIRGSPLATTATPATQERETPQFVAEVASVATPPVHRAKEASVPKCRNVAKVAGDTAAKPDKNAAGNPPASEQITLFKEWAVRLQEQEGVARDRATWMAALRVFVLPDEWTDYFDGDALKPRYRQVSIAIGDGIVVTFHQSGRVSFYGKPSGI
ncbi:hypothetical protein [Nioella sp. MMSF_3534]|uniref:hypothetical protein n=1 Tax=Nioella sp. MMSF_3534 TaxID=3046720 RepID=UPI00273DA304|nr:hypothetical protein [Nioella sp. MMSF_3534]